MSPTTSRTNFTVTLQILDLPAVPFHMSLSSNGLPHGCLQIPPPHHQKKGNGNLTCCSFGFPGYNPETKKEKKSKYKRLTKCTLSSNRSDTRFSQLQAEFWCRTLEPNSLECLPHLPSFGPKETIQRVPKSQDPPPPQLGSTALRPPPSPAWIDRSQGPGFRAPRSSASSCCGASAEQSTCCSTARSKLPCARVLGEPRGPGEWGNPQKKLHRKLEPFGKSPHQKKRTKWCTPPKKDSAQSQKPLQPSFSSPKATNLSGKRPHTLGKRVKNKQQTGLSRL